MKSRKRKNEEEKDREREKEKMEICKLLYKFQLGIGIVRSFRIYKKEKKLEVKKFY